MGGRVYLAAAAVAISLILLNALYGHHIYGSPYGQSLSKYSVYVHLQPGWESAPANILYDVTVSWDGDVQLQEDSPSYNSNTLAEQNGREAVVLQHGFSDCQTGWSPPLYRYGADTLRSAFRYASGEQLNWDAYVPLLPDTPNASYTDDMQAELVGSGYAQFVPVCTSRDSSSFRYSVLINDPGVAFDVHFVPSPQELDDYIGGGGSFEEYDSCGAANRQKYTGHCHNVGPHSGLLIVLPDALSRSITHVQVGIQESTSIPGA